MSRIKVFWPRSHGDTETRSYLALAITACDLLSDPELLAAAKEEFAVRSKG